MKCDICGAELVDGKCASCDEKAKTVDALVKEKLDALAGKAEDKTAGEKQEASLDHNERMRGIMQNLARNRPDLAVEYSDNKAKNFTGSGNLIPWEFHGEIYTLMDEYGVARQECRIHPIQTRHARLPKLISGFSFSWIGSTKHKGEDPYYHASGTRKPVTEPEATGVIVNIRDLAGVFPMTTNTLDDTNTNFEQLIPPLFALAMSEAEDLALFNGVAYPDGTTVGGLLARATAVNAGGATFADATVANLIGMQGSLSSAALRGAKYYMHPSVLTTFLQEIYQSGGNGAMWAGRMTLENVLGYPIVLTNALPSMAQSAGDTRFIVLGNLANTYLVDRQQLSIDTSNEANVYDANGNLLYALWQDDMVGFRAVERLDIQVMEDSAYAALRTT